MLYVLTIVKNEEVKIVKKKTQYATKQLKPEIKIIKY